RARSRLVRNEVRPPRLGCVGHIADGGRRVGSARTRTDFRHVPCDLRWAGVHDSAPYPTAGKACPSRGGRGGGSGGTTPAGGLLTKPEVVAAILWLSLTAYAVLAGADFGGGLWDLLAIGPRAADQRQAIAEAMGPVWEANHDWLIFMIVGLFTAFPSAFGILALALFLPLTIALM